MNELALTATAQNSNVPQLDLDLESIIKSNLENANKLSLWALDSYAVLTAVSARADDLEKQGLLARFWGSVTGQNRKMSIHNQQDLAHAQMLAQEMLIKMSEQNAISFEIALSLGDKLSLLEQDFSDAKVKINDAFGKTQEQIKGIYQNLNQFFDKVKSKIEELEAEFRRNDDLLFWKETLLEHKVYDGLYYEDMNNAQKILCMVQEFFTVTKGHWNSRDISFLRSSLRSVGITPDMPIKPLELVQQVHNDPGLLEHLVSKTNFAAEFSGLTIDMPMLASLKQTIDVKGGEKHIIDTIAGFSPDTSLEDIENAYITNTMLSKFGRSLEKEHKAFDVAVDLLGDLLLVNLLNSHRPEQIEHRETSELPLQVKGSFDYAQPFHSLSDSFVLVDVYVKENQFVNKGKILASIKKSVSDGDLYFVTANDDFTVLKISVEKGDICYDAIFSIDKEISNQNWIYSSADTCFKNAGISLQAINLNDIDFDHGMTDLLSLNAPSINQSLGEPLDLSVDGIGVSTDEEFEMLHASYEDKDFIVIAIDTHKTIYFDDAVCTLVRKSDFLKLLQ